VFPSSQRSPDSSTPFPQSPFETPPVPAKPPAFALPPAELFPPVELPDPPSAEEPPEARPPLPPPLVPAPSLGSSSIWSPPKPPVVAPLSPKELRPPATCPPLPRPLKPPAFATPEPPATPLEKSRAVPPHAKRRTLAAPSPTDHIHFIETVTATASRSGQGGFGPMVEPLISSALSTGTARHPTSEFNRMASRALKPGQRSG